MLGKTPAAGNVPSRTQIPSKFPSETFVERHVSIHAETRQLPSFSPSRRVLQEYFISYWSVCLSDESVDDETLFNSEMYSRLRSIGHPHNRTYCLFGPRFPSPNPNLVRNANLFIGQPAQLDKKAIPRCVPIKRSRLYLKSALYGGA